MPGSHDENIASPVLRIVIAGAHGGIGLCLTRRLAHRGDSVVGLIRNPDHAQDVRTVGGEPVVCDLEPATVEDIAPALAGAHAVVFAAGAGPGSGSERKLTVDRDGAIKLLLALGAAGVRRYLMISSSGAEDPPGGDDVFSVYLRAKAEADRALQASDCDWTIVRPGRLTDDAGTGTVRIATEPFRGQVSRDDVAAVLDALVREPRAGRRVLYVNAGEESVGQALAACLA